MVNKKSLLLWIVIGTFIMYLGIKSIKSSIVLKFNDRLNVVLYSSTPVFYSLSLKNISYFIPFQADYEMLIPGGFGQYRLGALGKLAYLEKKPDLIQKTLSAATSSMVDIYFYPKSAVVYYGRDMRSFIFPSARDIFFSVSNASWIDRIILFFMFSNRNKNQYKLIKDLPVKEIGSSLVFDRIEFFKKYQGFLYKKIYRKLDNTVQIRYVSSYDTAQLISAILEGEGIRVVDISPEDSNTNKCMVIQNSAIGSTASEIARYLSCTVEKGKTDISDIILSLGNLEEQWSVE